MNKRIRITPDMQTYMRLHAATMTVRDMAAELGIGPRSVESWCRGHGVVPLKKDKPWSEEDIRLLMKLYNAGKDEKYIAERLGRTVNSIYQKISRLKRAALATKPDSDIREQVMENASTLYTKVEQRAAYREGVRWAMSYLARLMASDHDKALAIAKELEKR